MQIVLPNNIILSYGGKGVAEGLYVAHLRREKYHTHTSESYQTRELVAQIPSPVLAYARKAIPHMNQFLYTEFSFYTTLRDEDIPRFEG